MPFIPVPDCVHAKIEGQVDGQTTLNNIYFRSTIGARSAADVLALANAISDWYSGSVVPLLNIAYLGRRVSVRGLTNALGFTAEVSMLGDDGAITGEALPNNCSMAVSFRTGLAGRSNHGRNYVPVMSDSEVNGNVIDTGFATSIVDAYSELIFPSTAIPDGWIWVVVSRFVGGEPRTEGVFQEIMSVQVSDLIVDSMRSRLPGRGR